MTPRLSPNRRKCRSLFPRLHFLVPPQSLLSFCRPLKDAQDLVWFRSAAPSPVLCIGVFWEQKEVTEGKLFFKQIVFGTSQTILQEGPPSHRVSPTQGGGRGVKRSWLGATGEMYGVSRHLSGTFPGGLVVKNQPSMQESQETQVRSLCREDPLEKGLATPVFLPGESHGQRSLAGYGSWGPIESDMSKAM